MQSNEVISHQSQESDPSPGEGCYVQVVGEMELCDTTNKVNTVCLVCFQIRDSSLCRTCRDFIIM